MTWSMKPFNAAEMRSYLDILSEAAGSDPMTDPNYAKYAELMSKHDNLAAEMAPDNTGVAKNTSPQFAQQVAALKTQAQQLAGANLQNWEAVRQQGVAPQQTGQQLAGELEEGDLVPTKFPRRGLDPQQKRVKQMPALFRPHKISVLRNKTDPKHPARGKFVGDSREPKKAPVEESLRGDEYHIATVTLDDGTKHKVRITSDEGYREAIEQHFAREGKRVTDIDMDFSVRNPYFRESQTSEDILGTVKKGLNDYLHSLEKKMDPDRGLVDKAKDAIERDKLDRLMPVKTVRTHDGREIKIHGNETDGFTVRINERPVRARFKSIDDAEMACEMYCNRRAMAENEIEAQDYVDED